MPELRPRALLLDMDGTLTRPMLDFAAIRQEIGLGPGRHILESIAAMEPPHREIAQAILARHEEEAAAGSSLNPGCPELLAWARQHQLATALITRNTRKSIDALLRRHTLSFDLLLGREDGPFKPNPYPLLRACAELMVAPETAWMIGDGSHDIEAAAAAGIRGVWVSHRQQRPFAAEPWRTVVDLQELLGLLQECAAEGF